MKKKGVRFSLLVLFVTGILSGCVVMNDDFSPGTRREQEGFMEEESLSQEESLPQEESSLVSFPFTETGGGEVSEIVERVMPAVVSISCICQQEYKSFLGHSRTYEELSDGSGIIIGQNESELLIVTNNHVIEDAAKLQITFVDDERVEGRIKGSNATMDLAVVAVDMEEIPEGTKDKIAIGTLGDSDSLKAGERIIAIGNAMGYGQSVTVGYISALNREIQVEDQSTKRFIQIDAAINPGNSGGALLNMQGEIIGINSAKISLAEVEGMGYAIPMARAWDVISSLSSRKTRVSAEKGRQGYLGIQGKDVSERVARFMGIRRGICIRKIAENGAAMFSELQEEDIITEFDGQTVKSIKELEELMLYYEAGETVEVTVLSLEAGEYIEHQVIVTLGSEPGGRERDGGM